MKTNQQVEKLSVDNESFFLDTNIIVGRVFESERNHLKCIHLLTSQNMKFTSETVKMEAESLFQRRNGYFKQILVLKYNLKNVKNKNERYNVVNDFIAKIAFNENNFFFLKTHLNYILRNYWTKGGLEYYRTLMDYREKQLIKCFNEEISHPIINQSNNNAAIDSVNALINNRKDSQILIDMIEEFIFTSKETNFTTMDKKDLLEKSNRILNWFKGYFDCECFFKILGISEALKKIVN